jgi:hypothetical protein
MNRGVIVGGGLMAASFLVAVMLNRSAHEEAPPTEAARQPSAHVCANPGPERPGAAPAGEGDQEKCTPSPAESAQR